MLKTVLTAIVASAATATLALAEPRTSADQIEAAERAFAADGAALGMRDSFLKHMASDAIIFTPQPTNAASFYGPLPSAGGPKLQWWPAWIVSAKSGDLGLSLGPARINDQTGRWYATIWRKDADGRWRWIYDGGSVADTAMAIGPKEPAVAAPIPAIGEASPAKAFEAVRAAETALAQAAATDTRAAYQAALGADAHLMGPRGTRALLPTAIDQRLALRPTSMALTLRGGGASKAGDFVWTYGEAQWSEGAQNSAPGHYMHVWQRRPEGWRLIFEALINDR